VLSDLIGGAWSRLTDRGSKQRHANAMRSCAATSIGLFRRIQLSHAFRLRRDATLRAIEIPCWPNRIPNHSSSKAALVGGLFHFKHSSRGQSARSWRALHITLAYFQSASVLSVFDRSCPNLNLSVPNSFSVQTRVLPN
jgi:hypothetical protein